MIVTKEKVTSIIKTPEQTCVIAKNTGVRLVTVGTQGLPGPAGAQGLKGDTGGTVVTFNQSTPDVIWTINHNLGRKTPVTVYTVGGVEMFAEIIQTSVNQTLVYFDQPTAGYAIYA